MLAVLQLRPTICKCPQATHIQAIKIDGSAEA